MEGTGGLDVPAPADRRYSCAATSQGRGEPVLGTASPTRGYLLVEEPGPWGSGAVPSSRLGPTVTAALLATAQARSSKLLLVRRPVRAGAADGRRRLFRVVCRRGAEQVLTRECAVEDVAAAAADETGWTSAPGPLLLVCTHGRKDWCCALRGRPLAAAVADLEPDGTWECSHLGGCRFAGNLLALPSGLTYGHVGPDDVAGVVAAVAAGEVLPALARGRTTDAMVVQAADAHARAALGRTRADDLAPTRAERVETDGTAWRITLAGARGLPDVVVDLDPVHLPVAQRLTCSASEEQFAHTWRLLGVREVPVRPTGVPRPPARRHGAATPPQAE